MKLRSKTVSTVIVTMCLVMAVFFALTNIILEQRSLNIEEQIVRDDVKLAREALSDDIDSIDKFVIDWSAWDDTYEFIKTKSRKFIQLNLSHDELLKQQLSFIVFVDASGKIIYSKGLSLEYDKDAPVLESLLKYISASGPLISHPDINRVVKGIIALPECPVMIVSRPVVTSEFKGPIAGSLIIGKYISLTKITALVKQTHLSIEFTSIDTNQIPASITQSLLLGTEHESVILKADTMDQITGHTLLKDIYDKPGAFLSVHVPRVLYQQYLGSLKQFIVAIILIILFASLIVVLIIEKILLSRMSKLFKFIASIQSSEKLSERITITGSDEIAAIGSGVNKMLETLEQDVVRLKQAEIQTRESKDFLDKIFKTSADGIIIASKNYSIIV
ncbi:MAG: CHASE4 domain-containing protein, partial [Pseudomonadota bacterium]